VAARTTVLVGAVVMVTLYALLILGVCIRFTFFDR
jgi:hypothetical protein